MADITVTLVGWGSQGWNGSYNWGQSPAELSAQGSVSGPNVFIVEVAGVSGVSSSGSVSDVSVQTSSSFVSESVAASGSASAPLASSSVSFGVTGVSASASSGSAVAISSVSNPSPSLSSSGQTSSVSIFTEKIVYVAGWSFGSGFGEGNWGDDYLTPSGSSSVGSVSVVAGGLAQPDGVSATGSASVPSFSSTGNVILSGWNSDSFWGSGGWGLSDSPSGIASVSAPLVTSSNITQATGLSATGSVSSVSISSSLSLEAFSISGFGYSETSQVIIDGAFSVSGVSSAGSVGSVSVYSDPQVFSPSVSSTGSVGDPLEISSPSFVADFVSGSGTASSPSIGADNTVSLAGFGASSVSWGGYGWGQGAVVYATAQAFEPNISLSFSVLSAGVSATGSATDPNFSISTSFVVSGVSGSATAFAPSISSGITIPFDGWSPPPGGWGEYPWGLGVGLSATGSVSEPSASSVASFSVTGVSGSASLGDASASGNYVYTFSGWNESFISWGEYGWGQGTTVSLYGSASDPSISVSAIVLSPNASGTGSAFDPLAIFDCTFSVSGVSSTGSSGASIAYGSANIFLDGWNADTASWGNYGWGQGGVDSLYGSVSEPIASSLVSFSVIGVSGSGSIGSSEYRSDYVYTFSGWNESFISWGEYGWGQGTAVSLYGSVSSPNISVSATVLSSSVSATGSAFDPIVLLDSTFNVSGVSSTGTAGTALVSSGTTVFLAGWNANASSWGDYGWGQGSIVQSIGSANAPSISADHTEFVGGVSGSATTNNVSIESNENISIAAISFGAVGSVSVPQVITDVIVYLSGWGSNGISWGDGPWGFGVAASASGSVFDVFAEGIASADVSGVSADGSVSDVDITSEVLVSLSGWGSDSFNWGEYGWGQGAALQAIGSTSEVSFSISEFYFAESLSATASASDPEVSLSPVTDVVGVGAAGFVGDTESLVETIIFLEGWGANAVSWGDGDWGQGVVFGAIGTASDVSAEAITYFDVFGVSGSGLVEEVSTLGDVTIYLAGWNFNSGSWGDYGWGEGSSPQAFGSASEVSFSISELYDSESLSATASVFDPDVSLSSVITVIGLSASGSVADAESSVETIVFLAGWNANAVSWGDGDWGFGSIASATGTSSEVSAEAIASFEVSGVSGYVFAGDVSTLDEVTVYLAGWGADSVPWGDYGWGQGSIASAFGQAFTADLVLDIEFSVDGVSGTGSSEPPLFRVDVETSVPSVYGEGFVNAPFAEESLTVFLGGWGSDGDGWGELGWSVDSFASASASVASVNDYWNAEGTSWGSGDWGVGYPGVRVLLLTEVVISAGATGTGEAFSPSVFVSESQSFLVDFVSASGSVGLVSVPGDTFASVDGVSGLVSAGTVSVVTPPNVAQISWLEVERDQATVQVSWLEVERVFRKVQVSWLFLTPYTSVGVNGVSATAQANSPYIWLNVNDSQIPDWNVVPDDQGSVWTNIPGDIAAGWQNVNDSQTSIWAEVEQSQNPSWNCSENSTVPNWMVLQDAQNSEWSCVNVSEGPNWACADSAQNPGWSLVSDSQSSDWFQIAA